MTAPLADRMRPATLDEVVGQDRWLGPDAPLRTAVSEGRLRSLVLWGPPGCGKTTIARCLANDTSTRFVQLSAVLAGVKELRGVIESSKASARIDGRGTLLFVDEIHRWNKAQQDALLPHVESGTLILVGATTENPSFQLNKALRSRLAVIQLDPLDNQSVRSLLERALSDDRGLGGHDVNVADDVLAALASAAAGDGRRALCDLERLVESVAPGQVIDLERAKTVLSRSDLRHDRDGDDHYDVVSALIKSMRGSDPDAAIYWLARMIAGGEDAAYIARRLVIFASEDIGNADPRALPLASAALDVVKQIGLPEGRIVLAQAVTWLATCPKSNASYKAIDAALADVRKHGALPVPPHLRNQPPPGSEPYRYPHDQPHRIVRQQYLPTDLLGRRYYEPSGHGGEKTIAERLDWWKRKLDEGG